MILILVILSVRERIKRTPTLTRNWQDNNAMASPVSKALANLVGTAGGIYLSVVMLIDFLKLNVPPKVELMDISLEPLAAISISIAIVQPFILRMLGR
ncbi:hypothetical protein V6C27_04600 [Peptococcaceae bacterium 1198_IL3148]